MTLAFSTQLNKKPTFFVEKIKKGLLDNHIMFYKDDRKYIGELLEMAFSKKPMYCPKIHTIRHDENERWKAGMDIHFVINNRTKNRYQFAPVVKCVSVQEINIVYWYNPKTEMFDKPEVYIDKKVLNKTKLEALALNDGFDSVKDFFAYFNTNFNGKLIHWTNTKY